MPQCEKKKSSGVFSSAKWSAVLFCAASINVGQVSASQSADIDVSATINVPISVTCNTNVQFGTLAILSTANLASATLEMNPGSSVQLESSIFNASDISGNFNQSGGSFGECVVSGVSGDFTVDFAGNPITLTNSSGTDSIFFEPVVQGTETGSANANATSIELFEYDPIFGANGTTAVSSDTWTANGTDEVTIKVGGHLTFPADDGNGGPVTADFLSGTHTGTVTMEIVL